MINFKTIDLNDLWKLAKQGKVGPPASPLLLIQDSKPLWFTDNEKQVKKFIEKYKEHNFIVKEEGRGKSKIFLVFKQENSKNYDQFMEAFKLPSSDPEYDIGIGRALGYSEADIAAFLVHNLTIEKFLVWQQSPILAVKKACNGYGGNAVLPNTHLLV